MYNEKRKELWGKLTVFLNQLKQLAPEVDVVYVDGSFTTDKDKPKDIDIIVELDNAVAEATLRSRLGMVVDRTFVKNTFSVDLLFAHRSNNSPNDMRGFFQKLRVAECSRLGVDIDTKKGLLRTQLQ